jgi:hypothetical protein
MPRQGHVTAVVAWAVVALASEIAWGASPCVAAADSAQDLRAANKLIEARAQLVVCSQRSCNPVVRADCERWLKEVDEQIPSIVVRTVDARGRDVLGATVTVDGAKVELDGKPVQVDPGPHVIAARAKSGDVSEHKALVALGEKARVVEVRFDAELDQDGTTRAEAPPRDDGPKPTPAPSAEAGPSRVPVLALAGVGVLALGAFGYFEIAGHAGYSNLEDGCYRTTAGCSAAEIDPVRAKFVAAGVSLGVSTLALAGAAILYFVQRPPAQSARRPFVIAF